MVLQKVWEWFESGYQVVGGTFLFIKEFPTLVEKARMMEKLKVEVEA